MAKLQTTFLEDRPVGEDSLRNRKQLSDHLWELISTSTEKYRPRSIGLVGEWGSGKSSVIEMLRVKAQESEVTEHDRPVTHIFIYDTWAHEGDALRRSFLEGLLKSIKDSPRIPLRDAKKLSSQIWSNVVKTTTRRNPKVSVNAAVMAASFVLIPVGLKFLSANPSIFSWYNIPWLFLAAAPIFVLGAAIAIKLWAQDDIKRWYFSIDEDRKMNSAALTREISALSVFVDRSVSRSEDIAKTDATDSIFQFQKCFLDICLTATDSCRSKLNIVVVIDNLDRLDPDQARAFWATMQVFVKPESHPAGQRDSFEGLNLSLIVPFSLQGVKPIFSSEQSTMEGEDDRTRATGSHAGRFHSDPSQSFLDKSFDIILHVPPPIQARTQKYLASLLNEAFSGISQLTSNHICQLYLFPSDAPPSRASRGGDNLNSRRSPRQMKIFINQLVSLYRIRGEEFKLEILAAYILCRPDIEEVGLPNGIQFGSSARRILPDVSLLQVDLAAIHFGTSREDAQHVLLGEKTERAILNRDGKIITELAESPGLPIVLLEVLQHYFGRPQHGTLAEVLAISPLFSGLPIFDGQEFTRVRSLLADNALAATSVGDLSGCRPTEAVSHLLRGLEAGPKSDFLSRFGSNLGSLDEFADPSPAIEPEHLDMLAEGWCEIASGLLTAAEPGHHFEIRLPVSDAVAVRALDCLSARELSASQFGQLAAVDKGGLATAFIELVRARPLSSPRALIRLLANGNVELLDPAVTFDALAEVVSNTEDPQIFHSGFSAVLAIAALRRLSNGQDVMRKLLRSQAPKFLGEADPQQKAEIFSALVLFDPGFQADARVAPTGQPLNPQQQKQKKLRELQQGLLSAISEPWSSDIQRLVYELIDETDSLNIFARNLAEPNSISTIGPNIMWSAVTRGKSFELGQSDAISLGKHLLQKWSQKYVVSVLDRMSNRTEVARSLIGSGISRNDIAIARCFLKVKGMNRVTSFKKALSEYIENASIEEWSGILSGDTSAMEVLELAEELRASGGKLNVGVNALLAIKDYSASASEVRLEPDAVRRLERVIGLLPSSEVEEVARRAWRIALGEEAGPEKTAKILHAFGPSMGALVGSQAADILHGPFSAVLRAAQDGSDAVTASDLHSVRRIIERNKAEFTGARNAGTFRRELARRKNLGDLPGDVKQAIKEIRELFPARA